MSYGTVQAEKMTTESGYSLGAGNASSFKNRIINGGMTIAQRATSVSAFSGGGYQTLDRWNLFQNLGAMNIAQSSTAPTGFNNSMQFTVSTAASQSSSSTSVVTPNQSIEGFNTADLMWGTANAKSITVSVWVYSNLVGQYAIWIRNSAADRYYTTPFTITTANTWQQISVTIPGDTSGTWVGATNGIGATVGICLAAGSSRVGTANTWSGSPTYGVTGQVDWQATASNTFYFTGFQLEVGTVATSFDYRPYGTELALCQRYYYLHAKSSAGEDSPIGYGSYTNSGAGVRTYVSFPTTMRTAPSIVCSSVANVFAIYINSNDAFQTFTLMNSTERAINLYVGSDVSGTAGDAGPISSIEAGALLAFDAEL